MMASDIIETRYWDVVSSALDDSGEESNGDILLNPISDVDIPTSGERFRTPDDALTASAQAILGRSRRESRLHCFDVLFQKKALKTQVANCTKTNLENKSVNDTLTAELERYKEQVKVLKEGQNVDLRSKDNVSDTCAQSVEIDLLKQTLSEHLKEKESLLQTVTLLKNDFKKEESRNIDREIALEKQIKHLDNIVFKRDQSAQTVHMLTKPQFFYDNTTKQALGFQNPFYLQKAQQSKPKLYVGDIIVQTNPIVIPDSEETLALTEESRSKMILKHKDNMMLEKEKQVDTTPIDYAALNQLYKDFPTRFVPQTELSAEQAFWSQNSVNSSEPTLSIRPMISERISKSKRAKTSKNRQEMKRQVQEKDLKPISKAGSRPWSRKVKV
ncbi:hypothetical protein Tco_0999959 [Tanacetum coccineum]